MAAIDELKLLRTTLSHDRTLFTVQRKASPPNNANIRVDCFASKGMGSSGLMRITGLVASVLKYRRTPRGLVINNREDLDRDLVSALSIMLELELKHQRINTGTTDSLGSV